MTESIIFRGLFVRSVKRNNSKNDQLTHIEVSCDWTDKVREHMHWGDVSEGHGASDLVGTLRATHLILTPSDRELRRQEVQLNILEASGFNQVPKKDGEGNFSTRELRFTIKSADRGATGLIEGFVESMGQALCQARVSYISQDELDLRHAASKTEESDPDSEPEEKTQLSIVDGMSIANGGRAKKQRTRRDMAAAMEATVEVDPEERERLEQIIEGSLQ